jgi:hypothetical protein
MPLGANRIKTQSLTGAAQATPGVSGKAVDVSITGTFVGTVSIQRQMSTGWVEIEAVTAPAQRVIEHAVSRQVRCVMSAYTSGSADIVLEAGA